jgi:hypothetical protein
VADLERIVELHSLARRLTNEQLRDQINIAFEERDHRQSLALYLELQRRQDRGTWDVPAPAWAVTRKPQL